MEESEEDLRIQIAEEERLIRIYEAELSLMHAESGRKQQWTNPASAHDDSATDMEHDWSETLEALQQSTDHDEKIELNSRWHDDPAMYRLLPLVSGIAFTSALPRALGNSHDQTQKAYEFKGNVVASNTTPTGFTVVTTIAFDNQDNTEKQNTDHQKARVVSIESLFEPHDTTLSAKEELYQISKVSSETFDLPLLYRQLLRWAEFDLRRKSVIENWKEQYGHDAIKRLTAETFSIHVRNEHAEPAENATDKSLTLVVSWKWNCFWHGSGDEELKISNVTLHGLPTQSRAIEWWANEIRQPQGLEDLVSSVGGSKEKAIEVLLQTLFSGD